MVMPASGEEANYNGPGGYWLLVLILLATFTYAFVDRVVLSLLVDPIKEHLRATDLQMGLLLGLGFAVFYAVLSIPAGHLVDRQSRRNMIALASLGWSIMTIVCGTSDSMTQLFIGRAGVGICESVIMPACFSLIRDAVPTRHRGLAFSIFAMAPILGTTAAMLGGGVLLRIANAGQFGGYPVLGTLEPWQSTMVLTGAVGLSVSALLALVREPARPAQVENGHKAHAGGFQVALLHMRGHTGIYIPLILFVTFAAMMNFSISAWLPAMIGRNWSIEPEHTGSLLGSIYLPSGIAGLLFSGFILNWLTARGRDIRVYGMIAAGGTAIGLVAAAMAPSLTWALMMVAILQFFIGTSYSVGASTLGEITPSRLMGRTTAIYFLFQSLLGQALGPFLVAVGSQSVFSGSLGLGRSLAACCALFGGISVASAWALRQALKLNRSADEKIDMTGQPSPDQPKFGRLISRP